MKLKPVWTLEQQQEALHASPDQWSVVHYCAECWAKMQGITVDAAKEEIWGRGGAKKRWRAGQFIRRMEVVREEYERAHGTSPSVVDPGTRDVEATVVGLPWALSDFLSGYRSGGDHGTAHGTSPAAADLGTLSPQGVQPPRECKAPKQLVIENSP